MTSLHKNPTVRGLILALPLLIGLAACSDSKSSSSNTTIPQVSAPDRNSPSSTSAQPYAACTDAAIERDLKGKNANVACSNGWAGGSFVPTGSDIEVTFIARDINGVWVDQDPSKVCPGVGSEPAEIPYAVLERSRCKVS